MLLYPWIVPLIILILLKYIALFLNIQLDAAVPNGGDVFMQKEVEELKDTIRVSQF